MPTHSTDKHPDRPPHVPAEGFGLLALLSDAALREVVSLPNLTCPPRLAAALTGRSPAYIRQTHTRGSAGHARVKLADLGQNFTGNDLRRALQRLA